MNKLIEEDNFNLLKYYLDHASKIRKDIVIKDKYYNDAIEIDKKEKKRKFTNSL